MSKQDKFFMSLKILSRDETPGELSVNVNNIWKSFWLQDTTFQRKPAISKWVKLSFSGNTLMWLFDPLLTHKNLAVCQERIGIPHHIHEVMRRSIRKVNIPPPGNPPGIWTFEDWLVHIPSPWGKKAVQMPHQLVLNCLSSKTSLVFNQALCMHAERDMP